VWRGIDNSENEKKLIFIFSSALNKIKGRKERGRGREEKKSIDIISWTGG
jgi:hypothetical protein